jgi:hypothetical protein
MINARLSFWQKITFVLGVIFLLSGEVSLIVNRFSLEWFAICLGCIAGSVDLISISLHFDLDKTVAEGMLFTLIKKIKLKSFPFIVEIVKVVVNRVLLVVPIKLI